MTPDEYAHLPFPDAIAAARLDAARAMQEQCARVVENFEVFSWDVFDHRLKRVSADDIAAAIRALKLKQVSADTIAAAIHALKPEADGDTR